MELKKEDDEFLAEFFYNLIWIVSKVLRYPPAEVSKWSQEIYEGILELNENNPELFYTESEIPVEQQIRYYDSYCFFSLMMSVVQRAYEIFEFFFINAKMGVKRFWVRDVEFSIENNKSSFYVFLEGSILN